MIRKGLSKLLTVLCATSLITLVIIVLLGIISKQLKLGLSWTDESAEFLLTWVVMLGAALAYLENAHLGVDILTNKLASGAKRVAMFFATLTVSVFSAWVMVYGGWQLFQSGLESGQQLSSIGIRKAWFYLSVPLSGLMILIFSIDNLRRILSGKDIVETDEPSNAPEESIG